MSAVEALYDSPQPIERRPRIRVVRDDAVVMSAGESGAVTWWGLVQAVKRSRRASAVVLWLKLGSIGAIMVSVIATGVWSFLSLPNVPLP
ncbi:MAG: hypothetical protein LBV00_05040 [Propionibacteriaceae bacterium]|jgi:hypothetical protein|nr:hypothetical protein [Propionibacteriaceae bacterium]